MVIVGLGNDLVAVARIRRTFLRFGPRFLTRAFHPIEINEFNRKCNNGGTTITVISTSNQGREITNNNNNNNKNNNRNNNRNNDDNAAASTSTYEECIMDPTTTSTSNSHRPFEYLASLWAVKEALYKAFGGVDRKRLNFTNMKLIHAPSGKPSVVLEGSLKELASEMGVTHIHVAITHDHCYVVANVILEQR